jgi:HD-GYP domain-containing protein (c-di-GMP phosphodiesterase class II)
MLARIGQVTVPPEVALKARSGHALTSSEQEMFSNIPAIGSHLLAHIPRMEEVSKIILYQNKRFDGSGFPKDKVAGAEIPLGARILKVLFDLAELESRDNTRAAALELLRAQPGAHDPQILDAVAACFQAASQSPGGPKQPPVAVTFAGLRVGHVLASDVLTSDGMLIVAAGNRVSPALIHRLQNFSALSGIKTPIYVEAAMVSAA